MKWGGDGHRRVWGIVRRRAVTEEHCGKSKVRRAPPPSSRASEREQMRETSCRSASDTTKESARFNQPQPLNRLHRSSRLSGHRRLHHFSSHYSFYDGGNCSGHRHASACWPGWQTQRHHQHLRCEGRCILCSP